MKTITKDIVLKAWKEKVCKHGKKIDASVDKQACWHSLFIGFALGMGLSLEEATNYDLYINKAFLIEGEE